MSRLDALCREAKTRGEVVVYGRDVGTREDPLAASVTRSRLGRCRPAVETVRKSRIVLGSEVGENLEQLSPFWQRVSYCAWKVLNKQAGHADPPEESE